MNRCWARARLDRFCHRAHQFVIEGDSYRKRTAPGSAPEPKTSSKAKGLNPEGEEETCVNNPDKKG